MANSLSYRTNSGIKTNETLSLTNIDTALFQLAFQFRELSQKKNELNQQIKVCRADVIERTSYIKSVKSKISQLEEETRVKQSTVAHNKANAKSMRATNSLLLQYEQTLKAELESRKDSYSNDTEVYEEKLTSYRKIFQSHQEYYHRNPLAQELLVLQAENEAIECRIKSYDEQIIHKQKKLDYSTANSSPAEELRDNVSDQQPIVEPEKEFDHQTEEDSDSCVGISCLHLNQTKNDEVSAEINAQAIHEEIKDSSHYTVGASNELCSYKEFDEPIQPHETHTSEQDKEGDQVMERQTTVSEIDDKVDHDVEGSVSVDEDPAPSKGYCDGLTAFPHSSPQETSRSSSPAKKTAVSSTKTLGFNFSSTSLSQQGPASAFPFTLNSVPSTPAFSGFGFDIGSPQDEDSSFAFTSSFFSEKKTSESKSLSCSQFLFDQPEQNDDFQFPFTSKSHLGTKKDKSNDDEFPFSFNF
ncbi:uncharacterized protein LOC114847377 isoform X2 [Betta splendens]|uniref:Uncharacterized protein LOC114847377 isoform X2 n=1 Tax=Betta splendens TaxID=158456 RepID=A0A6P7LFF8_BETSP|nr:uncharacterized protein LOC114847377 isoform X2 [Betta splendens]